MHNGTRVCSLVNACTRLFDYFLLIPPVKQTREEPDWMKKKYYEFFQSQFQLVSRSLHTSGYSGSAKVVDLMNQRPIDISFEK